MGTSRDPAARILRSADGDRGSLPREHLGIDDIDGPTGCVGVDLVEDVGKLKLPFFVGYIAEVRRTDDVFHLQQWVLRIAHRLLLINVHRRHAGPLGLERRD